MTDIRALHAELFDAEMFHAELLERLRRLRDEGTFSSNEFDQLVLGLIAVFVLREFGIL